MSVRREDFSPALVAAVEEEAAFLGVGFAAGLKSLLAAGAEARRAQKRPESGPNQALPQEPERAQKGPEMGLNKAQKRPESGPSGGNIGGFSSSLFPEDIETIGETQHPSNKGECRGGKPEPPGFKSFWLAYPVKSGKGAALRAWARSAARRPPDHELLVALEAQKSSPRWSEGTIPNPATWLNQDRWEDDPASMAAIHNGNGRGSSKGPPPGLERSRMGGGDDHLQQFREFEARQRQEDAKWTS